MLVFKNLIKRLLTVDAAKRPNIDKVCADPLISKVTKKLVNDDDFNTEFKKSL